MPTPEFVTCPALSAIADPITTMADMGEAYCVHPVQIYVAEKLQKSNIPLLMSRDISALTRAYTERSNFLKENLPACFQRVGGYATYMCGMNPDMGETYLQEILIGFKTKPTLTAFEIPQSGHVLLYVRYENAIMVADVSLDIFDQAWHYSGEPIVIIGADDVEVQQGLSWFYSQKMRQDVHVSYDPARVVPVTLLKE